MRRLLALLIVCLFAVFVLAAGAAPSKRSDDNCTWGASSVMVEELNGQLVQSEPVTTGCIP